eukprot:3429254-Amphidinium_carterae.1
MGGISRASGYENIAVKRLHKRNTQLLLTPSPCALSMTAAWQAGSVTEKVPEEHLVVFLRKNHRGVVSALAWTSMHSRPSSHLTHRM